MLNLSPEPRVFPSMANSSRDKTLYLTMLSIAICRCRNALPSTGQTIESCFHAYADFLLSFSHDLALESRHPSGERSSQPGPRLQHLPESARRRPVEAGISCRRLFTRRGYFSAVLGWQTPPGRRGRLSPRVTFRRDLFNQSINIGIHVYIYRDIDM